MKPVHQACLPPAAYTDPSILEREKSHLFRVHWQWAGLMDDVRRQGGLSADIAGAPIVIEENTDGSLHVSLAMGRHRTPMPDAAADRCGRFVFVLLDNAGAAQNLNAFLGDYTEVLLHASEQFEEVFDAGTKEWACNWKSGYEITLEGYHVPFVHGQSYGKSDFAKAFPKSTPATFNGAHSTHTGLMSGQMRAEMHNIAKRLKINPSSKFTDYNHYALFPNMTIGFSGGCLCFMQIYSPLGINRLQLRYVYILGRPIDPEQKPVPMIKTTLLNTWRDYTAQVLDEDKVACENFQLGVAHAVKTGCTGLRVERRVRHFQEKWRDAMAEKAARLLRSA